MKRVFPSVILFCSAALFSAAIVQKQVDFVKKIAEKETEVGYQKDESSKLLQETLVKESFKIETGVATIPMASTVVELFQQPASMEKAKTELIYSRGESNLLTRKSVLYV